MGKSSSAPAPDPVQDTIAEQQYNLSQSQFDFAKQQFGIENDMQAQQNAVSTEVANQDLAQSQNAFARQQDVFQPLQDQFIGQAENWDSPERETEQAQAAGATAQTQAANATAAMQRQEAAQGITPGSGRYDGNDRAMALGTALGVTGAENNARTQVRTQALGLEGDAINMGNGLAATTTTAGGSAAQVMQNDEAGYRANVSQMNQGYAGSGTLMGSAEGSYNDIYGDQVNAWQANNAAADQETAGIASAIGTIGMAGAMAYANRSPSAKSSRDYKEDKAPSKGNLRKVKGMPVEDWTYKKGIADEGRHTGPYAEDFQRATGLGDGKSINLIDAVGVTMGAVQELDQKVDRLVASVGRLAKAKGLPSMKEAA